MNLCNSLLHHWSWASLCNSPLHKSKSEAFVHQLVDKWCKHPLHTCRGPTIAFCWISCLAKKIAAGINRKRLEAFLHKFFGAALLDVELKDRFGFDVTPREWFFAPYPVIEEAIGKLKDGSIGSYRYDPETAEIVLI